MSRLISLWRNLLRRDRVERGMDDELRAMFELLVDENVRAGMTCEAARRAARVELGNIEALKDHVRDARTGASIDTLARDFRHAARTLAKRPGVPLIIVITFALGSAGVTTIFALVNAILIRPLPYAASERLAAVKHAAPGLGLAEAGLSSGTYLHYRAHAKSFEALAVYSETVLNLSVPEAVTERVQVTYAGPELFEVLGVRPALGRLFTNEDARPGFADMTWPVPVLLSHECWQRRYGGDPSLIGRTITLNNRARHVVGVLPATFSFPRPETEIWMLFVPQERSASFATRLDYSGVARLRPGVSAAVAATELDRILPSIEGVYADATAERLAEVQLKPIVVPLKEEMIADVRAFLLLLFGGTTFLLLVAYANISTLSLLRAEHRHHEMAVRIALGARPADLMRLLLCEAALLSTAGAALGLLITQVALKAIVVLTPVRLPRLSEVELDGGVFAFACSLATVGALLFGGLAFLRQSAPASTAASALNASTRITDDRRRLRTRNVLVAVQVALALTLMVGSALMVQSFWRLTRVDPGFDPSGVLTIEVGLPGSRASRHQRIYEDLLVRVRALPGVRTASAASSLPLDGTAYAYPLAIGGLQKPTEQPIAMKFVMPGYFQTMRTPIVDGAGFALDTSVDLPNGVFVSAAFARRYFPGESPIGKNIRRLEADGMEVQMFDPVAKAPRPVPAWTIVGVVAGVREESLRVEPAEIVYVPVRDPAVERSITPTNMALVIRSDGYLTSSAGAVRQAIREVDTSLSIARIRPMDAILTASVATERFLAALLLVASAASLFLGAIGVYGVAAQAIRRREQEFGIRMTLGARPGQIVGMVLRESAGFVLIGTAAGLTTAFAATRALRTFLFEVSATDPATVAAVTALVIAVALMASLLPARRAVRLDPVAALRSG
jgi:putative ABC transport system permease protein